MQTDSYVVQVAVPVPVRHVFDYLVKGPAERVRAGMRVEIPFGRGLCVGLVVGVSAESKFAAAKLKPIHAVIDLEPVIAPDHLDWLLWVADYYEHPVGETLFTALPSALRQLNPPRGRNQVGWRLTESGRAVDLASVGRAPKQQHLLQALLSAPDGILATELAKLGEGLSAPLRAMVAKGWVESFAPLAPLRRAVTQVAPMLNLAQHDAVEAIAECSGRFQPILLDGVTGSGKTEVYLQVIARVVAQGQQAIVLIPEIGLTPQLVQRFKDRFGVPIALLHSQLSDGERFQAWQQANSGEASIVIGTRSAVFTPLPRLGVIIVDEEHDSSYKQFDGLRYHARDIALVRAQRLGIPIVLGSATPSLETLSNVERGRYLRLDLPNRAGGAAAPRFELLDLKGVAMVENFSPALLAAIGLHLGREEQVLLYLNRRGFAPTLLCHHCGWVAECKRCDHPLTMHRGASRLRCHHCGAERAIPAQCPKCTGIDLRALGYGTERVESFLRERFAQAQVLRIDRDTTRRKGAMDDLFQQARAGRGQILLGTQMLAKGHDLPNVTLVGILDADQGLFGTDFRAAEHLAQLIVQVAGRAGRGDKPGRVLIQTHHPDHPLLQTLVREGYRRFADLALAERRETGLPPYTFAAVWRAEATSATEALSFLYGLADLSRARNEVGVDLLGPVPSPMERKAGRYRAQLLVLANSRAGRQRMVRSCLEKISTIPGVRKVRWSLDIDPLDLS